MISLNLLDCPFLSQVMDEEIGSMAHPRSQSWARETGGESLGRLSADLGSVFCVEPENAAPFKW